MAARRRSFVHGSHMGPLWEDGWMEAGDLPTPDNRYRQVPGDARPRLRGRPFDLGGREAHAVALLQHLVGGDRLAVDADQVVLRLAVGDPLGEELLDGGVLGDPRRNRRNLLHRC